ncbi:MAG: hypothetical protein KGY45_01115 [Hadesarchaea archaeon]|nr:hypothetical protein [Hadesarchaea archaeon]
MGVRQEIRWLKANKDRADLFVLIAKRGPMRVRELREFLSSDDWWPVKVHIQDMLEKDLVEETEDGFKTTDFGEKVFESLRTVYDIESV